MKDIRSILPHRFPFLLIDKITEVEEGKRAVGVKLISQKDCAGSPNGTMPRGLILEAIAQMSGAALHSDGRSAGLGMLAGIDNCRFYQDVFAGERLTLTIDITRNKGTIVKARGTAAIDSRSICEADLLFAFQSFT
ncbi:3-hydroxyacyl-ACP dehydratase FabZ family protein [Rossellomorea marisflavi]|uniref:3-hydroxyacyl-ACP dehydratase FabZ family protein n=1 Tax=Rossellomorea marisflavi TaxID=189381 RepID=UPI003D2EFE7B